MTTYNMLHRFQETEKTVKNKVIQMAFSPAGGDRPEFKESCYRYMPNVVDFMDDYKKKHGYKNFSIELQKREANIFIDNLLYNIKANGFFCITKHDSLIVRKSNLEEILQMLRSYFDFIGFGCTVKVEKEVVKFDRNDTLALKDKYKPETCDINEIRDVSGTQIIDGTGIATEYKREPHLEPEQKETGTIPEHENKPNWWQSLDYYKENYGEDSGREMYEGQFGFIGKF